MGIINKLSVHLVNKIAAGEVIERPASVLKELVENAIDAEADRIDIAVEDGGRKLIQVSDNGVGMGTEDAALAFSPHATSKIADEEDLFNIHTMGFRGEALASIASISHATIRTRQRDAEEGWEVSASGEEINPPTPCAATVGTTVTIRDLFFNTPARRKFLRTVNTEFGHLTEQLTRLSLPHPQIAFTLRHNGRETLNLPAGESTRQRIGDLFNSSLAQSLINLIPRTGDIRIDGLIAPPSEARSNAKCQYIFLNGRYIRDRLISHALREAYRGLLAPNRYPVVFLFIEIDPADVDVNVHPTKIEVRFKDSNRLYGELLAGLKETLNRSDLRPDVELAEPQDSPPIQASSSESTRKALVDFFKSAPPPQPRLQLGESASKSPSFTPTPRFQAPPTNDISESSPTYSVHSAEAPAEENTFVPTEASSGAPSPLLQIHDSYIVTQTEDGMAIVDQHALHERILYNDFKARLLAGPLESQRLLIPQTFSATPAEAALLETHSELLSRLGLSVEPFGPNTLAIQQYPALLTRRNVDMAEFLREMLDQLENNEQVTEENLLESILAMLACKAAVKAGHPLSCEEMQDLLDRAEGLEKASSCPHGRPTTIQLTLADLEKQFHRT